jgi:hypothetical protein
LHIPRTTGLNPRVTPVPLRVTQPRPVEGSHSPFLPIRSELTENDPPGLRERRLSWAELMLRVFQEDVLKCPKCGGKSEVISAITQPKVALAILRCLGLSVRAPPIAPAPQAPFDL